MERTFKMIKVIDNFLDKNIFEEMKEVIMGNAFPWFHFERPVLNHLQYDWDKTPQEIENEDKKVGNYFFFVHTLYDNQTFQHFKDKNVFEISDTDHCICLLCHFILGWPLREIISNTSPERQ